MVNISFSDKAEKKVKKEFPTDNQLKCDENSYYFHPTFCVKNLSEYIHLVTTISSVNNDSYSGETVIFRGMSDSEYDLTPGLARLKNIHSDAESELINEFLTHRPDAFRGLTNFDVLAKMQHYGLPTRLLDFSSNPLVALYFACESNKSKNGRVLCHNTFLQNDSSAYTNEICNTIMNKYFDLSYTVEDYFCNDNLSFDKYMSEAYLYNETTVIRPRYWNQRIANQAGLFMVFSNNLIDRYRGILLHYQEMGLHNAIKEYGFGKIDEEVIKSVIENEPLDYYNSLNTPFLTDKCYRAMLDSYRNKGESFMEIRKKNFANRFRITPELKALSEEKIKNDFCSIIIESKNKRKILRDLSYVGIGADYIYPELEYTAKEIKRKFD